MTERITQRHLDGLVQRINRATNSPEATYTKTDTGHAANIGNYHLDGAYGGWELERMVSEGGGVSDVFRCGHITRRDLYNRMRAFLAGIEAARA